jgi:2-dehydropantoate 2-reductase
MRIGIMGAGGIGSVVGGLLSKGGHDVTLIDQWWEHIEKIKADGLIVETQKAEYLTHPKAIHIHELQHETVPFDAAFIAVKSYDTEWATTLMLRYVDPDHGVFVDFQNGINDERMAAIAGVERSLGCVITIGAAALDPGRGIRTDDYPLGFKIGEHDGADTPRARELVEAMNSVADAEFTDDLWGNRWSKLMINCMANALSGVSGYGTTEVRTEDDPRKIGIQLGAEVARVALAQGINLYPVFNIPSESIIDAAEGRGIEEVDAALLEAGRRGGVGGVPSFGQDVRKGRRNEIDYLNGLVSDMGKKLGVPTPFNDKIVEIVHDLGIDFKGEPKNIQPLVDMLP